MPDKSNFNKIWSEYPSLASSPSARIRVAVILSMIKKMGEIDSLLDIGCGKCLLLNELRKSALGELYGMDIAATTLNSLSPAESAEIQLIVGDVSAPESLPDRKFDVIVCSEVLEHIEDDVIAMRNIKRLIAPGGKMIITVPFEPRYWTKGDEIVGHYRRYARDELEKKLRNAGYNVKRSFVFGWPMACTISRFLSKRIDAEKQWKEPGILRKIGAEVLFYMYNIDRLFTWTNLGIRQFAIVTIDNNEDALEHHL